MCNFYFAQTAHQEHNYDTYLAELNEFSELRVFVFGKRHTHTHIYILIYNTEKKRIAPHLQTLVHDTFIIHQRHRKMGKRERANVGSDNYLCLIHK